MLFRSLARTRLGYQDGMAAIAADPMFDDEWRSWIRKAGQQLGMVEFADLIYYRSAFFVEERRKTTSATYEPTAPTLFGRQEGRIARANRGKDPLYLFAALQRQLGYPSVPRSKRANEFKLHPLLELRISRLEKRLQLAETEAKGKLDLAEFYLKPTELPPDDPLLHDLS